MLTISISTDVFNKILKRLLSVSSGDDSSTVTFVIQESELILYYKSKIDKGETCGLFHEKVPTILLENEGSFSIFIKDLNKLKIPEFIRESRYPHCKEVTLQVDNNKLTIKYDIIWAEKVKPNTTEFKCTTLIENYEAIYQQLKETYKNYIELDAQSLIKAISHCSFFKHDVTTKSSNGCLLQLINDKFLVVGTDSNIAACYKDSILSKSEEAKILKTILSDSVCKLIKFLISDIQTIKLSITKSFLFLDTGNRKMIVPVINSKYLIDNPIEFFSINGKKIANILLRPINSLVSLLVSSSKDDYKTIMLDFTADNFNIVADENVSKNMPSEVFNTAKIFVNGDYFNITSTFIKYRRLFISIL